MDEIVRFPKPPEEKKKVFDRKFTISLKTLSKILLVIIIAVAFFCLGRYYFPDVGTGSEELSPITGAAVKDTSPEIKVTNLVEEAEPVTVTETPEEAEPAVEKDLKEEEEETFVNSNYKNVGLAVREFSFDWFEDWGKINKMYYTISNDEAGTVQPKYFEFVMDGYGDFPKIIEVPPLDQKIPEGKTFDGSVEFVFTYNQNVIDPANALVKLTLFDGSNNTMASLQKNFDLTK